MDEVSFEVKLTHKWNVRNIKRFKDEQYAANAMGMSMDDISYFVGVTNPQVLAKKS